MEIMGKVVSWGVYSGRLASGEKNDLQLGLVWNEVYIDHTVRGQRRDGEPQRIEWYNGLQNPDC